MAHSGSPTAHIGRVVHVAGDSDLGQLMASMNDHEQEELQAKATQTKAQLDAAFLAHPDAETQIRLLANGVGNVFSMATNMFGPSVSDANIQRYWGAILAVLSDKWQHIVLAPSPSPSPDCAANKAATPDRVAHLATIRRIRQERLQASVASVPASATELIAAYWKLANVVLPLPA